MLAGLALAGAVILLALPVGRHSVALALLEVPPAEQLGDLHRVERGALAQVVADTHHSVRPFSTVGSSRTRLTKVAQSPAHSTGVTYPPSSRLSISITPGASRRMSCACSALISFSNSMLIDSEWPTNTGTRTQVALTLILGSRIFLVSTTIFHSSLVEPSSRKPPMCGITLKAICLVNLRGSSLSPTKIARLCSNSSSIPAFPAPETDW